MMYIFVEGIDDRRFVENIIVPAFKKSQRPIKVIEYSQKKTKDVIKLIQSFKINQSDYIFLADKDIPTTTKKIEKTATKYQCDKNKISIVVIEIEAWYLAGYKKLDKISKKIYYNGTDNISKDYFKNLLKQKDILNIKLEILEEYDLKIGIQKNRSLSKFFNKYLV